MGATVQIQGAGVNAGKLATSDIGEVLVRAYDYSDPIFQDMDLVDTAYPFFAPVAGKQLIITDIFAFANRNVTTQTQVDIYEATADDTLTITKQIVRLDIAKLDSSPHHGLFLKITEGVFVNGKCDDDDAFVTVAGYYIPVVT